MATNTLETYVSVDVETAGPNPGEYALLSIGACLVSDPKNGFYVELKPTSPNATQEALAISRLSIERLMDDGLEPAEALTRFRTWLQTEVPDDRKPIFVAFNAPFDWMFVNTYFHRFLGYNPFGHAALDVKSYFMGMAGVRWSETTIHHVSTRYRQKDSLTHHALQDARDQAILFQMMLDEKKLTPR